jgi:alkanesulfonate monooxygenase SsuD/methylene tetrahydromethanopterin reductase-like flavin-dependent oxidoreductase (luciferase family)
MLPSFVEGPDASLEAARQAEAAGLHGVFAYNHLWPLGLPGRPAIWPFPLLAAIAVTTSRLLLGTLVARVGITPPRVLLGELISLDAISLGRFIAGIGTGDAKSRDEHLAYGLPYPDAATRRAQLGEVAAELSAAHVPVWVGGGGTATHELARRLGASVNLWSATPEQVADEAALGPVTWGGRWPREARGRPPASGGARPGRARAVGGQTAGVELITELRDAGAHWAVFTWPGSVADLAIAAELAGISLASPPPAAT